MQDTRRVIFLPFILLLLVIFLAPGYSDPELKKATNALKQAEGEIANLKTLLTKAAAVKTEALGQDAIIAVIPNLVYLRQYAGVVRGMEPDMAKLVSTLETEGTVHGGLFSLLQTRLANAKAKFTKEAKASRNAAIAVTAEATAIAQAAKADVFNDSLVDVINVLAGMSKGKLARLKFAETTDKTMPPTQNLVGNPAYGSWQSAATGGSFWVWYGQYRLFSDVLGWGRYRYNRDYWYRSRSPSYYGDIGRYYYGTRRSNRAWSQAARRQPNVAVNKASPSRVKSFRSSSRLSNYAPRTRGAPRSMARRYRARRASYYSNARSAPSRSGGFGRRSFGK